MNISQHGLEFITSFEGFVDHLYNDPAGHCTVGIGHLLHHGNCDGRSNEVPYLSGITKAQALTLLGDDVVSRVVTVNDAVTVPLNQNQFDALVSFVFNLGAGAFRRATFLGLLNAGHYDAVPDGLKLYVKAGGVTLPGLVRRRQAEADLWNTPVDRPAPPPDEEEEEDMIIIVHGSKQPGSYYLSDWLTRRHIGGVPELTWYRYIGVREALIPQKRLDDIPDA